MMPEAFLSFANASSANLLSGSTRAESEKISEREARAKNKRDFQTFSH